MTNDMYAFIVLYRLSVMRELGGDKRVENLGTIPKLPPVQPEGPGGWMPCWVPPLALLQVRHFASGRAPLAYGVWVTPN